MPRNAQSVSKSLFPQYIITKKSIFLTLFLSFLLAFAMQRNIFTNFSSPKKTPRCNSTQARRGNHAATPYYKLPFVTLTYPSKARHTPTNRKREAKAGRAIFTRFEIKSSKRIAPINSNHGFVANKNARKAAEKESQVEKRPSSDRRISPPVSVRLAMLRRAFILCSFSILNCDFARRAARKSRGGGGKNRENGPLSRLRLFN